MMTALALLALPAASEPLPWGEFSTTQFDWESSTDRTITVEIGTVEDRRPGPMRYWMREKHSGSDKVRYADSRDCPAVQEVVASMREIASPSPAPPGFTSGASFSVITDVQWYHIRVPVEFSPGIMGQLRLGGDVQSPLHTWFRKTTTALQPCWAERKPDRPPPAPR